MGVGAMDSDKTKKLQDELTEMYIMALYNMTHPSGMELHRREYAIEKYRTDYIFNSMVKSIVYSTMDIIVKHYGE
jgi:hypothetical protein